MTKRKRGSTHSNLASHPKHSAEDLKAVVAFIEDLESSEAAAKRVHEQHAARRTEIARNAANMKHASIRQMKNELRVIFASGKYGNNRSACAIAEHEKLGLKYETARKALINAPAPAGS